jgi:hypothetical protein
MPQTSVADNMTIGIVGALADANLASVDSRVNEEASAEIPFGVMVVRGTAKATDALLLHTSAAVSAPLLAGVVLYSAAYAKPEELGDDGVKPNMTVGLLQKGRVYVLPEEAVEPGDDVRVRAVAGGSEQAGAFRTTADDTSDCIDISSFARWITAGSSTVPAVVEIDMTSAAGAVADS